VGRAPTVGRPALFATTSDFLQQFGLTGLEELPGVVPTITSGLQDVANPQDEGEN